MFRTTSKSPTLALNELMKSRVADGETIYRFGFGEAPFLPLQRTREALQAATYRTDYTPVVGLPELRERVAAFHSTMDARTIQPEQVIVGAGSKILLFNMLMAFEKAVVFMAAPSWVSYAPQAQMAQHRVQRIPTTYAERWRMTPQRLDEALSQVTDEDTAKVLILNVPGNPDGMRYSKAELQALTVVLRKHEVWVIADEIYALLDHDGQHVSLATVYPERTFVTGGLSKWCGAGGWRLGTGILPENTPAALNNALIGMASETYSCAAVPVQLAAVTAYQADEETQQYLEQHRRILKSIGQHLYGMVLETGIQVHAPEGGFYMFLDFSPLREGLAAQGIHDDLQLCERMLAETGVALLPGTAFGMPSEALTARLAFVDFDGEASRADIDMLDETAPEAFVGKHAAHMIEGLEQLSAWLRP